MGNPLGSAVGSGTSMMLPWCLTGTFFFYIINEAEMTKFFKKQKKKGKKKETSDLTFLGYITVITQ